MTDYNFLEESLTSIIDRFKNLTEDSLKSDCLNSKIEAITSQGFIDNLKKLGDAGFIIETYNDILGQLPQDLALIEQAHITVFCHLCHGLENDFSISKDKSKVYFEDTCERKLTDALSILNYYLKCRDNIEDFSNKFKMINAELHNGFRSITHGDPDVHITASFANFIGTESSHWPSNTEKVIAEVIDKYLFEVTKNGIRINDPMSTPSHYEVFRSPFLINKNSFRPVVEMYNFKEERNIKGDDMESVSPQEKHTQFTI